MQLTYDEANPQAWKNRAQWCRETGQEPDSRTPTLSKDEWDEYFPDDGYPDGRADPVYCLPLEEEHKDSPNLESRIENLEEWREESQRQLAQLGQRLGAGARQTSKLADVLQAVAELLREQGSESESIADRLLALSLDDPSTAAAPGPGAEPE